MAAAVATALERTASYLLYFGSSEASKAAAASFGENRVAELEMHERMIADMPVAAGPAEVLVAGRADEVVAGQADVGSMAGGAVVDDAGDLETVARMIAAEWIPDKSAALTWIHLLKEAPRSPKVLF